MKLLETVKGWITLLILAAVGVGGFLLFKNWPKISATVSTWFGQKVDDTTNSLAYLFGKKPAGALPNNLSNSAGAIATQAGFDSVVNRDSQAFYDAALQQFAYDNSFSTSLAAQGTTNWPWKSYDDWLSSGEPHLQGEEAVYTDSNGVYHNDYM